MLVWINLCSQEVNHWETTEFLKIHILTFESSSERVNLVLGQNFLFKEESPHVHKYIQNETGLIFHCIWMA